MDSLVLASASPRRRELLSGMGEQFTVRSTTIDERRRTGETPHDYATRLAMEKAVAVATPLQSGLVIGADTIVVLDDDLLTKPVDGAEARSHLLRLRGRWHRVATAIAVVDALSGRNVGGIEWTEVRMREFDEGELRDYIASGDPFDKAGGYAIQDPTFKPVAELRGNEDNVVGLPRGLLSRLLEQIRTG